MTLELPIVQLELRPGIIDLGWGHPDPGLLPVDDVRTAAVGALDRFGADALGYGFAAGAGPLRAWLRDRIAANEGRSPSLDEIMITGGSSLGLDQVCTLLAEPGDVVLVESPTYHLAVRILRDHPFELVPIPADAGGMRIDALEQAVAELARQGRRPRMLYCVPTFHNPTGVSLSVERRRALLDIAAREGFLVLEDDVYRELAFDGPPPPSLWSMDSAGVVVRLGSFAKSLAPGMRLGWLTGPAPLIAKITGGGVLDSGGAANHFTSIVVAQFCLNGSFERHVERLRNAYRKRRDALAAALRETLPPGSDATVPLGGFFTWVTLPEGVDTRALLGSAEAHGV
ncbi:MAG TPA: PLP-dependent aminotransferase family protein, partial [Roseiflexaceae bacterium]|nr:PLP-dependent aminotransferase family protein [Roseiflexaceae bacterium]